MDFFVKQGVILVNYQHWSHDIIKTVMLSNIRKTTERSPAVINYDRTFITFFSYLLNDLIAVNLSLLLSKYIDLLIETGVNKEVANNYVAQRLKYRNVKYSNSKTIVPDTQT